MNNQLVKVMLGDELRGHVLAIYQKGSEGSETNWIHTPSVVISWTTVRMRAGHGGHSLSSRVTRYAVDDTLAAGDVRILESGSSRTIFYSARDEARIHATVRQAGRAERQSSDALRDALRTAAAARAAAVSVPCSRC
jgi:hypothetical protein